MSRRLAVLLSATALVCAALAAPASADLSFRGTFGSPGTGPGQFKFLTGVAVDSSNRIYAGDCDLHRIQIFKPDQSLLTQLGPGAGPGALGCPFDLDTDGNDYVYVADLSNNRVQRYAGLDSDVPLDFIQSIELLGTDKQPCAPYDVTVDPSHNVWIVGGPTRDECQVVAKFDRNGRRQLQFGSRGDARGQFYGYMHVASDAAGNVYVSDFANGRVQKFDTNGSLLGVIGSAGTGDGRFYGPHGLTFDPAGNLWVAETGINHRIQEFTGAGEFAAKFGGEGTGPGQFTIAYDVAADSNCNVYATDTSGVFDGSERIQVFGQSEAPFCRAAVAVPPAPGGAAAGDGLTPGADPPKPPDKAAPSLAVTTTASSFSARRGFVLPLRANEDCTILASAKVSITDGTSRVYSVSARRASAKKGSTLKLRLKGVKKTNTAIAAALKRGRKLKAKVIITAIDKATNVSTTRATVKLSR